LALALGILSLPIALSVQAALTNQSKLVLNGIDGVRVGMTVSEASRAVEMQAEDKPNPDCYIKSG
jgi:hypothetical protein